MEPGTCRVPNITTIGERATVSDTKHPLDGLLEPESAPYGNAPLISIAISLKRIADAIHAPDSYENPYRGRS